MSKPRTSLKPGGKPKRPGSITTTRPSTPRAKGKGGAGALSGARLLLIVLALCGFLATLAALLLTGTLWYFGRDLPSGDGLRSYHPPQTTRIVDRNGVVLGEMFTERRTVVPMKRIPRVLVLSVLAAEDADFYHHSGMDFPGMVRVLIKAVLRGRATQGGSTITQQVVKNLLLTPERTLTRKIKELILARRIEQELSKDEILFLYLSHINFGHGRYGVQEAARFYFDKDVSKLNLAEASLIAGIPQSPGPSFAPHLVRGGAAAPAVRAGPAGAQAQPVLGRSAARGDRARAHDAAHAGRGARQQAAGSTRAGAAGQAGVDRRGGRAARRAGRLHGGDHHRSRARGEGAQGAPRRSAGHRCAPGQTGAARGADASPTGCSASCSARRAPIIRGARSCAWEARTMRWCWAPPTTRRCG